MSTHIHGVSTHGHAHSHDEEWPEDTWTLYQHIERVEGLNTLGDETKARGVFKPHSHRQDAAPCVLSDADEEMILKVWFEAPVNLRRIIVASCGPAEEADADSHPSSVRCFTGTAAEGLSFDSLDDAQPAQLIELMVNPEAEAFTQCKMQPFTQITFLLLHFPGNHGGAKRTRVSYVGLQGDHSHAKRQAVEATYELLCTHGEDTQDAFRILGLDESAQFGSMR